VTDEGMIGALLSPDGKRLVTVDRYGEFYLCPVEGGEAQPVEGYEEYDSLLQWSADGRSLFLREAGDFVLKIYKLDLASGRRELWKELTPPDPTGLIDIGSSVGEVKVTPDGKYYVYTSWNLIGELYLVEGLK
jgi:Tol biopolymer transport system component